MVNVCAFDVPPPGVGFTTLTDAVPAVAMRAPGTVAVSCVAETNAVVSAVPFHLTVEPDTKLVPFTVSVNCPPPAVAHVGLIELVVGPGLLIVNVCEFEVPPPGAGVTTVTDAVPEFATRAAVTVAVSWVEETNVVVSAVPFQRTDELATKLLPFTVIMNCAAPARHELGLIEVVAGTGLLIVNACEFEVPPPGAGFTTVTDAVPAFATRAAVTVAVSCVAETNVVVKAVPFQRTDELATKLLPFTVIMNCAAPARHEFGLIEVVAGTGLLMVKVTGWVTVAQLLNVTLRVTLYVPVVVGVPEIEPVDVLTVRPGGNPVAP